MGGAIRLVPVSISGRCRFELGLSPGVNHFAVCRLGGNIEQEPASGGRESQITGGRFGLSYVLGRHVSGTAEFAATTDEPTIRAGTIRKTRYHVAVGRHL